MKLLAVVFVLALAACAEGPSDTEVAYASCSWARDNTAWHLCMERAQDRLEARRAREEAVAGAMLINSFSTPRTCTTLSGITTCQ